MVHRIQGTITSLDNGSGTLELDDSQVLTIPLRDFQPRPQVGDTYVLHILPENEARLNIDELARTLLSQLITDVPQAHQNTENENA
jgi:hypothetical protein